MTSTEGAVMPTRTPARTRSAWLLVSLFGGMFLGNVDIAIVNIATPSIREHLHATGGELELVVSGYTLAYAMLLITGARLGDLRGRRKVFLVGLVLFTVSSLACGLAPNAAILVGERIAQGVGAALMISQVLTWIKVHFDGPARSRALGAYAAVLAGSAVIGQVLGGLLVAANLFDTGWRPIFLVNVPIGIALIVLSLRYLPVDPPRHRQQLDLPGVVLLSVALFLLIVPLVLGQDVGWPPWTWVCLFASLPAFVAFVAVEQRIIARGGYPLITVPLLARRPVALALISQAMTRATYFALLFVLALYLQQGLGKSPAYSGLMLVSWVAAFGVAGPLLGRLDQRAKQLAAPLGTVLLAVGFAGVAGSAALGVRGGVWLVLLLAVGGLGYGAAFSGTLGHLTNAVDDRYAADVSGMFNTTLQVGGALGVAVFGTVYLDLADRPAHAQSAFVVITAVFAITSIIAAGLIRWGSVPP
jgi:MFS family permease